MYLFTRQVIMSAAHVRAGMAHALDMLAYVNDKTELNMSLFQVLQGSPVGTLVYANQTESYAATVAQTDELTQSEEFLAKIEQGAALSIGNAQDHVAKFVHVAGEISGPPAAANLVSARLNPGQLGEAMTWSVELADYLSHVTDVPVAVLTSNSPDYGTVSWLNYGESLAQLEEADEKVHADAGFRDRMAGSQGYFVPGSGASWLSRRLG